jgi:hypothetical protein
MSIAEWKNGTTYHAWQALSPTSRKYLGTFSARTATEAGTMAANRHNGGIVLVKVSKFGATIARV